MKHLKPSDISFVVHGPIDPGWTKNCVLSIRKHFGPKSEIIVSTWPDASMDCIYDYDKCIMSKDPGPNQYGEAGVRNLNRHILSVQEGIKVATRKYVCKVRSDMLFLHGKIVEWFDLFDRRSNYLRFFEKRICVTNLYTLRPNDQPCYISDFVYFGLRDDVEKLFNIPFMEKSPLGPEQYIASTAITKAYNLPELPDTDTAEQIMGNNFQVIDGQRQFGVLCQKYPHYKDNWHHTMMTHMDWINLYYKRNKIRV